MGYAHLSLNKNKKDCTEYRKDCTEEGKGGDYLCYSNFVEALILVNKYVSVSESVELNGSDLNFIIP